jgi:hypothetical protein
MKAAAHPSTGSGRTPRTKTPRGRDLREYVWIPACAGMTHPSCAGRNPFLPVQEANRGRQERIPDDAFKEQGQARMPNLLATLGATVSGVCRTTNYSPSSLRLVTPTHPGAAVSVV